MEYRPRLTIRVACCVAVPLSGAAADYSWQLAGAATRLDTDASTVQMDADNSAISAVYYFGGVKESDEPLALAAFFDPVPQLSASLGRASATTHSFVAYPSRSKTRSACRG